MKYTKKDLGSYNLHMIKTDKFKTVTIKIIFQSPIIKEEITKRNILSDILLQSSNKYPSKRDLIIAAEDLYSASIYNSTERLGKFIMTSFTLQVLNDKYTEENNLNKGIEFLREIIFNPDVEDSKFKENKLSFVKKNCEVTISSIKEDPISYAVMRMSESYDKDSPISYRMVGYMDDIEKVDTKNLYEYYKKMIEKDYVDIFVVGDIDEKEILAKIKECFRFRKLKKGKPSYELEIKKPRKKRLIAKEKQEASQSKLIIACPLKKMKQYEKNYPLVLANIIFGGTSDSKLFKIVREKNSLCYAIYSQLSKLDNLITIKAGIDKDNFKKTLTVVDDVLNKVKKGDFTEKDINMAKEIYSSAISNIEESPASLISEYLTEEITGLDSYKKRVEIMNKVTKKDIKKVIKKMITDTIFLLEGDIS